jgi:hypothetical protein
MSLGTIFAGNEVTTKETFDRAWKKWQLNNHPDKQKPDKKKEAHDLCAKVNNLKDELNRLKGW